MRATAAGIVLASLGSLSIFLGLFSGIGRCAVPGTPCPSPRPSELLTYGGMLILVAAVVILVLSGWRGSAWSWVVAAAGVFIATWVTYEFLRQGPCQTVASGIPLVICNAIPFSEASAPALSAVATLITLAVGRLRLRQFVPRPRGSEASRPSTEPLK